VRPLAVTYGLWGVWVVSWGLASFWRKRTAARAPFVGTAVYLIPTVIGGVLMGLGGSQNAGAVAFGAWRLWRLSEPAGWVAVGLVALGFAFTWWARVTLGDLWSSAVTRKEGHELVERGPYRLVRHPIYTGLILAAVVLAAEIGTAASLAGAALMSFGFWLKARLEERFLGDELGQAAYADYRRRTPMLIPFWPVRG
jgi:protein-S-isoprenylcysteine O-methyltransferase Ste14